MKQMNDKNNELFTKLLPILKEADSLPFLFIGSGFSQRYLGTPNWEGLLKELSLRIDNNNFSFIKDRNEAAENYDPKQHYNNYMTYLCNLISQRLNNIWYTEDKFKNSRVKYEKLITNNNVPPLKIEIANIINQYKVNNILPDVKQEFQQLQSISDKSIAGIITTNYDDLIESIFDFITYTSQDELLFHNKYDLGEIYKIHGTVDKPESIMITKSDYDIINSKHKYISAKLLTIFIEHPIFFIGYSLGDEDIREILHDILTSIGKQHLAQVSKRIFFVQWDQKQISPLISNFSLSFEDGQTLTMGLIKLANFGDLYKVLGKNKIKYPVSMIRYAKNDIYNYVLTSKPSSKVALSLPNKNLSKEQLSNLEFIYGFGILERARQGYSAVTKEEIFEDIVFDDKNFNYPLLVKESLPIALRASSGFLPIRKYIQNLKQNQMPLQVIRNLNRFSNLNDFLSLALQKCKKDHPSYSYNDAIKNSLGIGTVKSLAIVNWENEDIEKLGNYLRGKLNKENFQTVSSDFRRLIRIYDFYKYK